MISRNPFLLREAGPRTDGQRWLSARASGDVTGPVEVLERAGVGTFSVLQTERQAVPEVPGAKMEAVDRVDALGVTFEILHYRFLR